MEECIIPIHNHKNNIISVDDEDDFETITFPTPSASVGVSPNSTELNISAALVPPVIVLVACIVVLVICGNLLTIIAVRTYRRLRSVISNLFILSLAVSDFIVGFTLPYHISFFLNDDLKYVKALCLTRFFLVIFSCSVSMLTLIAIAIDRYIAIVYAIHYRRFITRHVAYYVIFVAWVMGITIAAIPMFWNNWNDSKVCLFSGVLPKWYIMGIIVPSFFFIWIFMFIIYYRISRVAAKQSRLCFHKRSEWKSVQIVLYVMGCFSLCWLPYLVIATFNMFRFMSSQSVYVFSFVLAMTNSGLNPLIYAWKNSNFRKAFNELLCCKSAQDELDHSSVHGAKHDNQRQNSIFNISMNNFAVLVEAEGNRCPTLSYTIDHERAQAKVKAKNVPTEESCTLRQFLKKVKTNLY